jgi:hypothetical protein
MGSVGARLKTPTQGKNFSRVLQEREKIGAKEFEKKSRPRIIATRKAERKRFAKMESESSEYTLGKKTLLGA